MRVKLDCGKVMVDEADGWQNEAVPALIEIVSDLQRRIIELETWRERASR